MVLGVDHAGRTPLHYAALEGRLADMVAYLREDRNAVNLADSVGFTPLHFAAQGQQAEAARVLIGAGAQVGSRNKFGNTALLVALANVRAQKTQLSASCWTPAPIRMQKTTTGSAPGAWRPRWSTTSCGSSGANDIWQVTACE
jgi:hypothetical protein